MARKKGGINIGTITDKEKLKGMIINQINSLNKKIKGFKEKGIEEHSEYIHSLISDDMGKFNESGSLSKSKKFYEEKNTVWLKKTLSALVKLNNHDIYGTTNKYNKVMTKQLKGVKQYTENYLRNKGYDEKFISGVTNSKDFYVKLFGAFTDNVGGYGSNQVVEKVALNYTDSGLSTEEKDKILSNIEYNHNVEKRIKEENEAFEEFKKLRNGKKR